MDYRPHPFVIALFGLLLVLNAASVSLYALVLSTGHPAGFEAFHLAMSAFAISIIVFFALYYLRTHRRERPIKTPYLLAFGFICLANLLVSISVSVRAASKFCYEFAGAYPSNEDCKWGGLAIIFPWITTIFSAGGIIITIAERHLQPIETLTRRAHADVEREIQEWQKGCFDENLKRAMIQRDDGSADAPEMFNPYSEFNLAIPSSEPIADHDMHNSSLPVLQPIEEESDEGHDGSPESSPDSIYETPQNSTESIETDMGPHEQVSVIAEFPSIVESSTESNNPGPQQMEDVGEDLDDEPPMRRRKRPLPRPRRILSGAVRPPKDFVIRFKEPIAIPVREPSPTETPPETPALPSTLPVAFM